ncbi:MAG: hypothetical protein IKJ72_03040 [Mycoplasmataceae bacterium]|nr:hypothetical protein [Mycoplasmataceae bacterium]
MKKIKNKMTTCKGCGRHPKQISSSSEIYFCQHCVQDNGNYFRYKNGYPLIKPLKKIKSGDIVLGANGKPYIVIQFDYEKNEDKFYQCKQFFGTEAIEVKGDYFFYKKIKIRESKKIRAMIDNNINTLYLTYNENVKLSCLDCAHREGNNCLKKNISLLTCDANNCDYYC